MAQMILLCFFFFSHFSQFILYYVSCLWLFSLVSLLTCLIPQHSLVLMFSFSFKESQEREARKVDVFDFGKWFDATCKGNKIYHRGLLWGVEWKYCLFVTKDCLEDCFSLISLKPVSQCFHYKDFNVSVSFGKELHLFWNKSKAPQMFCLLSGPAHESSASGSHYRGVRRIFTVWFVSQVSQGVCMGPAPWQQRTARTGNVGALGQHSCPAVGGHGSSPAQGHQGTCTGDAVLHWASVGLW